MLVNLNKILAAARRGGYAIGAFNINNMELVQGIVAAAVKMNSPVVIQTSQGALEYAGMEYLAAMVHIAAETHPKIQIVLHLDHGRDIDVVERTIKSGWYSSVMIDASYLPLAKNIQVTRRIVELAHARGMSVEAELGPIFGIEDQVRVDRSDAAFTDPTQVKKFVAETKCDALAISVGTAHGPIKYEPGEQPTLEFARIRAIAAATKVPLVLHGASGVPHKLISQLHAQCSRLGDCSRLHDAIGIPDAQIKKAIKFGISKVNVDTDLRLAFTSAVRETLLSDTGTIDPRKLLGPARDAVQKIVEKKIKLFRGR